MRAALLICALLAGCATADFEVVDGPLPDGAVQAVASPEELARPGLFSGLFGGGEAPAANAAPAPPEVTEAGLPEAAAPEPLPRRGLFAGMLNRSRAPAPDPGADGIDLRYGMVVPVCGTPRRALGQEVARFPERGSGYRLYDSNPGTIALRPHYITGFDDGCPRKFLAALAVFGGIGAYETTRYRDGRNSTTVTETDTRYKAIRARACGAPVGRACPPRQFARLARSAVFVSVYERFGTSPTWADMLIHDGRVVAKDFKSIR
ncbi:MAG: hypothetical protein AAGH70_13285 [Pseudomonadota bacterium]